MGMGRDDEPSSTKTDARCSVCGERPITSRTVDDGAVVWHCQDHLPEDEAELYRALREAGFEAPPPRTIH